MSNLVILHISGLTFKKASGPTTSIPELVNAQNNIKNVNAALVLSRGNKPKKWDPNFSVFEYKKDFNSLSIVDLPYPYNKPDLVVFHSTYIPIHAKFAKKLNKRGIPFIIVPRGGMTKGSQNIKKIKKKIANILFFNKMVRNAISIHCLTNGEQEDTEFWNKKMFVVGNGMNLPSKIEKEKKEKDEFKFIFIGRLDIYHKGLDILIKACSVVSEKLKKENSVIEIYGPDQNGSFRALNNLIKKHKLEEIVKVFPPVFDEQKIKILNNTDVFLHTSRFEGHPMSVLEALSYGIPCLLTPGTNISSEVEMAGAGWEVEFSVEDVASGLRRVLQNKENIKTMSLNAIKLIENKYAWDKIAKDTVKHYRSLLLES